jgi:hypothetical protein
MAVVRLFRRKGAERDEKRPEVGLLRGPGGSDNLPGMAAFCGIPTANQGRKKNVPNGRTGGGRAIRTLGTIVVSEALSLARRCFPCSTRAGRKYMNRSGSEASFCNKGAKPKHREPTVRPNAPLDQTLFPFQLG